MPKEIKIMGYTINELEPEVRRKVIDNSCEINTDYDWYDGCYEGFHEELAEAGLECKDFSWDLYRNDFDFNNLGIENKEKLLSKIDVNKHLIPLNIATEGNYEMDIHLNEIGVNIYVSDEVDCGLTPDDIHEIEGVIENNLEYVLADLRGKFLKSLKDDYEYLTSEEAIAETLEVNEYLFTKEGKRI